MRAYFLLLTLSFHSVFARSSPPVVADDSRHDSFKDLPMNVLFAPSVQALGTQDLVCLNWIGSSRRLLRPLHSRKLPSLFTSCLSSDVELNPGPGPKEEPPSDFLEDFRLLLGVLSTARTCTASAVYPSHCRKVQKRLSYIQTQNITVEHNIIISF